MNFEITQRLLKAIEPYTENCKINVSTEQTDWLGRKYNSDFVTIDEKGDVCFEVLNNEIIMHYFTDHLHFNDYSLELEDGQPDFIERAEEFLTDLFTCEITHLRKFKGKYLISERYTLNYHDDEKMCPTGVCVHRILVRFNPFLKKRCERITYIFDKSKGTFENRYPKAKNPDAIEFIDINDDCYIEIFEKSGGYYYSISEIDYDDYNGVYFWSISPDTLVSGLYDSKEKAIEYAIQEIKKKQDLEKQ